MGDESCRLALLDTVAAVSGRVSGGALAFFEPESRRWRSGL